MNMPDAVVAWLRTGERGLSSEAIVEVMEGLPCGALTWRYGRTYPRDGDDLRRCILLLDLVPAYRARLDEMASVNDVWAALVGEWDALVALLKSEVGEDLRTARGHAPQTYARMRELITGAGGS